jgi:predicted RNase H-like HicB family nuclease
LTPDLEDGGYTGQCREIPGVVAQGETMQEVLSNIIEILAEHLEYVKEGPGRGSPDGMVR